MILTFKHKGLERFWKGSDHSGIPAASAARIERLLDRLDASVTPADMKLPGFGFHPLRGNRKGEFAVTVTANLRMVFGFDGADAVSVNLEDYH